MRISQGNEKKVSLLSAIFFSATCMVGSGWLFSAQLSAHFAGNWSFLAWILAALLILAVAFCYTPIVRKFPVRGVVARCSALSHNRVFGMPFSFASWFGILAIIPSEAQATAQYLASAIGSGWLSGEHGLTIYGKLLAMGILATYVVVNFYGVRMLSRINNIVTAFKVFTPLFIIVIFIVAAFNHGGSHNLHAFAGDFGVRDVFMALVSAGLIYSFNGFQICLAFASETHRPERTIPLAILWSVIIVLVMYLLLQYAFMTALPANVLEKVGGWANLSLSSPLLDLSMLLGFHFVSMLLVADSIISPSGAGYTYLGAVTRMTTGMSREKQLPRWLGKIHIEHLFSRRSLLFNSAIAFAMQSFADSWAALMVLATGYSVIGYMAAPISMGAISTSRRIQGVFVFALLGLLLHTLNGKDMLFINVSITVLLAVYSVVQMAGLKKTILYVVPIMAYLWLSYVIPGVYASVILSMVFYWFVTRPSYVSTAKKDFPVKNMEEKEAGKSVPAKADH